MTVISKSQGTHQAASGLGETFMYFAMAAIAIAIAVPAAILIMG